MHTHVIIYTKACCMCVCMLPAHSPKQVFQDVAPSTFTKQSIPIKQNDKPIPTNTYITNAIKQKSGGGAFHSVKYITAVSEIHNERGPRTKAKIKVLSNKSSSLVHSGPAEPDLSTSTAPAPRQRSKYFQRTLDRFDLCLGARAVVVLRSISGGPL